MTHTSARTTRQASCTSLDVYSKSEAVSLSGTQTITGAKTHNADLTVGTSTTDSHLRLYKADNNVSDHLIFFMGSTRMGEIGTQDTTWLRINQVTNKNIYTPRYIRADNGFRVDGTTYGIMGDGTYRAPNGTVSAPTSHLVSTITAAFTLLPPTLLD